MSDKIHHLSDEFPELKEKIQVLKLSDNHFKRLFDQYEELDKEINLFEQNIKATSDEHAETLKKKRLKLKDELYTILVAA